MLNINALCPEPCPNVAAPLPQNTPPQQQGAGDVVAPPSPVAAALVETLSYSGTLATGAYTRAAIIALIAGGTTKLLSLTLTVATGTVDFAQGGLISNLVVGKSIVKNYVEGFALDDFTITVDAASTAFIEVRGI